MTQDEYSQAIHLNDYYLEILEEGQFVPIGRFKCTEEEIIKLAKRKVDDALPNNTVHVYKLIGQAYLSHDGGEEYRERTNKNKT